MDYRTAFYGADVFALEPGRERAFIGNYQRLGYLRDDQLVQLAPHRQIEVVQPDYEKDAEQRALPMNDALALEAIAYYETASDRFRHGLMQSDATLAGTQAVPPDATSAARVAER